MGMTNQMETDVLKHFYQNATIPLIGDATGLPASATTGSIYVGLHTAYPAETVTAQTTSEAAYSGYQRQGLVRNSTNWPVVSGVLNNGTQIDFPVGGVGTTPETLAWWSTGTALSGAGAIIHRGPLCSAIWGFTSTNADVITAPGHTLSNNDPVALISALGGTLPAGSTEGQIYYAKSVSGDTFSISTTPGGSTVDLTAPGFGYVAKMQPIPMAAGITPRLLVNAINIAVD